MSMTFRKAIPRGSDGDDRRYDEACADRARERLSKLVDLYGTQTEVARRLGVNQSTIARSLSPHNQPSLRVIIQIARVLHISVDDVLGLPRESSTSIVSA